MTMMLGEEELSVERRVETTKIDDDGDFEYYDHDDDDGIGEWRVKWLSWFREEMTNLNA